MQGLIKSLIRDKCCIQNITIFEFLSGNFTFTFFYYPSNVQKEIILITMEKNSCTYNSTYRSSRGSSLARRSR